MLKTIDISGYRYTYDDGLYLVVISSLVPDTDSELCYYSNGLFNKSLGYARKSVGRCRLEMGFIIQKACPGAVYHGKKDVYQKDSGLYDGDQIIYKSGSLYFRHIFHFGYIRSIDEEINSLKVFGLQYVQELLEILCCKYHLVEKFFLKNRPNPSIIIKSKPMETQEVNKGIARLFIKPQDWKKRGSMVFDELLSIALAHPAIAEKEICDRFNYWQREFRIIQTAIYVIIAVSFALIAFGYIQAHNAIIMCVITALAIPIIIGVFLMKRRAKAIHENLVHCYSWLLNEIIHPDSGWCNVSPSLEKAFIKASAQAERWEPIEQKKFNRIIKGFGYSSITLNN